MGTLDNIDHVVVLMLENRSFDSMLGMLYPERPDFNGLNGTEFNLDGAGRKISVWNRLAFDNASMSIPDPDPGEQWSDINMQLFGTSNLPSSLSVPGMTGFVQNYMSQSPSDGRSAEAVMHYYLPDQVPVISDLARHFAVCDCWHASAPCQTWPNRFFVHTGTANGYENNNPLHPPYDMPTIFKRFENLSIPNGWKIYFHDMAQSATLSELWPYEVDPDRETAGAVF
jgi:phospholipase C